MKVLLFANTDWYLYNFRLSLARALRDAGHEVLLVSPGGEFGPRMLSMGFRWVPAPMARRSLNPLREMLLVWWLARLVRVEGVQLVHGFTIKCAVYGSLAARLGGAQAQVLAFTGFGYVFTSPDLRARLLRPAVRSMMRLALLGSHSRVILQNPDDADLLARASPASAPKVRLIRGSGVNCDRFQPRSPDQPEPRAFTVLLPARLLWDKGVGEYVAAARLLRGEGRTIRFLLAGQPDVGNPASVTEPQVREWVNEGSVEWLGHVEDMPALFACVDVVALPSYREGLPRGLIEAAAAGLALVTTDVPGCREVVSDGVDGLLVPPRDAVALARAVAVLQDDPSLRKRLGAAARCKALAEFDESIVIHRTLAVYGELTACASGEPRTSSAPDLRP